MVFEHGPIHVAFLTKNTASAGSLFLELGLLVCPVSLLMCVCIRHILSASELLYHLSSRCVLSLHERVIQNLLEC